MNLIMKLAWLLPLILLIIASSTIIPPMNIRAPAAEAQGVNSAINSSWSFLGQNQQNTWYSPQTIINNDNVATLKQVWSINLPKIDGTPVISDGIVYVTSALDGSRYGEYVGSIYAINESTGKLIWQDGPGAQTGLRFSTIAGIAVHNGNVFAATTDSYLVSLNANTGALNWKVPINAGLIVNPQATYVGPQGTPLVWDGKIIVSNVLGNSVARGFVRAFSESSGSLLWTFYTVPPSPMTSTNQDFYKKTWGKCTYCGGGNNWNVPAVDPGTGIIYFGTGNPAPYFNASQRSPSREYLNLYANSVIALNVTNGQMIWYYQEVAGDVHDWDAGMPVQFFNTTINGVQTKAVGSAGKNGYYYLLNAATGALIWSAKLGIHLNEDKPPTPQGQIVYPGSAGGSTTYYSYNPLTNSIYVMILNNAGRYVSGPIGLDGSAGGDYGTGTPANSTLYALNASTGQINWSKNFSGFAGGVSSSNNLVFTADRSGNYYALDARTGAQLWKYSSGKSSPFFANWGPASVTDGLLFVTSFTTNGGVMAFAPELGHTFVEVTTPQTRTGNSYAGIPGASIADANLVDGKKYLLVFTAQVGHSDTGQDGYIRAVHGSTPFEGSELAFEPTWGDVASRYQYFWFSVWKAVPGEDVKLQFKTEAASGDTMRADQITMTAIKLSDDLTEGADWYFNERTTDTALGPSYKTGNSASVTFTPNGSDDWLVLATAQLNPASITVPQKTRINAAGGVTDTGVVWRQEAEDATFDRMVETLAKVYRPTATSTTFATQSESSSVTGTRLYNSVFALNLNKLDRHSFGATAAEINLDTTDNFATSTRVATTTITPANAGDVWCLGFYIYDINSATYARGRMQIDNADQPPTQTSDFYGVPDATWDVTDEYGVAFQTIEKMTALPHTLDLDATTVTPVKPVEDRLAMCVTMELAP